MARIVECSGCHKEKAHKARGLCGTCYQQIYRDGQVPPRASKERRRGMEAVVTALNLIFDRMSGGRVHVQLLDGVIRVSSGSEAFSEAVE